MPPQSSPDALASWAAHAATLGEHGTVADAHRPEVRVRVRVRVRARAGARLRVRVRVRTRDRVRVRVRVGVDCHTFCDE